ncbi:chemotaxis protein CheB [Orrella sp. JC864]|uniref:chemotaxis protein CheB n=1 Tax=Orrella sp. JC864 TaxID=3120298 RepID=UPI00300B2FF6
MPSAALPPNDASETHELDDMVPSFGYQTLRVVGLGGSAGSLPALRSFLQTVPPSPGVAFVVVVHLSPDHESSLDQLLQQATPMRVVQVTQAERLEPDTVYVIAPRKLIRTMDGFISVEELPPGRPRHIAVDMFFRTLADAHGPHATAIVLSGADGDGSIGIKRIKERGGLTIVQDPDQAQVDGMPRSAIETGMVDWVLPVEQMAQRVFEYQRMEARVRLPAEQAPLAEGRNGQDQEAALEEILVFLRSRTGRNFTNYKRATILRRIGRRMQVNGVDDLAGYLSVLRTRAGEAGALLQDLLISVTNFFRDPECFAALEQRIPELFAGKGPADVVRVWVAACATGEEAYGIAMLLTEHARTLDAPPQIQVFATDLHEDAIRAAREGVYPHTIQADVSDERLRRFFIKEQQGYRIRRELRESVLFAVHDVLKDSPFSRIDLLTCRNLLIYLTKTAQARVLDTFHFAMNPQGILFLGAAESIDEGSPQFALLDKKHRLYVQRSRPRAGLLQPDQAVWAARARARHAAATPVIPGSAFALQAPMHPALALEGRAGSWAEMHLKLIDLLAPPSVLVDADYDIVHSSHSAGRFLVHAGGEPTRNLLRLIHPSLRIELRAALYRAGQSGAPVEIAPLALQAGGEPLRVALRVAPAGELAPGLLVVFLLPRPAEPAQAVPAAAADGDAPAQQLEQELERLKFHLRETVEQYEASTEELKASNEELQAMNEELRSATEELETSREELQSINEELTTVNQELKSKVDQLSSANSDMLNLMDATAIATVFLDRELCITRYTPSAVELFTLIPTDVGRPLSDLKTRIDYPGLEHDARQVLETLVPIEREVGQAGGRWLMVRVRPYRTLEDRIAGVVIAFVDITERKNDQELLRASEARYAAIVTEATVGVVQTTLQGVITFANRCYQSMLGATGAQLIGSSLLDHVHPEDRKQSIEQIKRLVEDGVSFQVEKRCVRQDGGIIWLHNSVNVLADAAGRPDSVLIVASDVTERKLAEDALRASEEQLRQGQAKLLRALQEKESALAALEQSDAGKEQFLAILSHELRNPLAALHSAGDMLKDGATQDPRYTQLISIVQRQSRTMKVLLDDLLDMSRLRLGKLSVKRRAVRAGEIVDSAVETVRPLAEAAGHTLSLEIGDADTLLHADPVRLSQVLSNLLGNAVKYTPEPGRITLSTRRAAQEYCFVVQDSGIGMEPDQVESMFQMFKQAPTSTQDLQGMGIGLALVRAIVTLHGGQVRGESKGAGQGSRFTVCIPLDEAPGEPLAQAAAGPRVAAAAGLDVLVTDDNEDVAWLMSEFLTLAGHRTRVATDGDQALALAQAQPPDVMLLDIGLPRRDGYEVARAVRAAPWGAGIFLIAATGWGQEEDRQRSRQAGFDVHLVKPIDTDQLLDLVARHARKLAASA